MNVTLINNSYSFDEMKTVTLMKVLAPEYKSQDFKYEMFDNRIPPIYWSIQK